MVGPMALCLRFVSPFDHTLTKIVAISVNYVEQQQVNFKKYIPKIEAQV